MRLVVYVYALNEPIQGIILFRHLYSYPIKLGLDPAKPGFEDTSTKDESLDPSDAEFVDVIHTCGGVLGYAKPLGHMYVTRNFFSPEIRIACWLVCWLTGDSFLK